MIDILLATYNSEKFLIEQLNSILEQDYSDFRILIRDGGSKDLTCQIIADYQKKFPNKIEFIGSSNATTLENFSELLKVSTAPLIMFSDHDDVWLMNKISTLLKGYKNMAKKYSQDMPILVYSDSYVVDEQLNIISNSTIKFQHLNSGENFKLANTLVQNIPNGNTMLLNRSLINLAMPIAKNAVMHDHWITLVATCFGKISYINEPLLKYRQHSRNVYGAYAYSFLSLIIKLSHGVTKIRRRFYQNIYQAQEFLGAYQGELTIEELNVLKAFASFDKINFIKKRYYMFKYGLWKHGFLRNIGMFFIV